MDDDYCRVRWCHEHAEHPGPHRRRLIDTFALTLAPARAQRVIVQVWLTGESARTHVPELVIDGREIGLTWQQADDISRQLHDARRRFATS